jgi:glycosyltransferase involved in cell wall biosynthesis
MSTAVFLNHEIAQSDHESSCDQVECIRVMHLTDSLALGGTERVAVNFVNCLPRDRFEPHLCTTRRGGPLESIVASDVQRIDLQRKGRFDLRALRRLVKYIRDHEIQILHAHSSSLLVANMAARFKPYPKIVWHDHFGRFEVEKRPAWQFRMLTRRVTGVIAVSKPLAEWSRHDLGVASDRVWYLPNFPSETGNNGLINEPPGQAGQRIICVANLRPEKDHLTLIDAMRTIVDLNPTAHLLLVGGLTNAAHVDLVRARVRQLQLGDNIHVLGPRQDVSALLRACDIGVLSSVSEGLPLSLLEYGLAGLPVVATDVGQCRDVLDNGACGALVPSGDSEQIALAIVKLLQDSEHRQAMALRFQNQVKSQFSTEAALKSLIGIYQQVLSIETGRSNLES